MSNLSEKQEQELFQATKEAMQSGGYIVIAQHDYKEEPEILYVTDMEKDNLHQRQLTKIADVHINMEEEENCTDADIQWAIDNGLKEWAENRLKEWKKHLI